MIRTETRTAGRKGHRADGGGGSLIMATQQSRSAAQSRVPGPGLLLAAAPSSALFLSSPFQMQVEKHESLICHKPTKVPSWTLVFTTWNVFSFSTFRSQERFQARRRAEVSAEAD